jgi:type IV pilus assembly protein PilE
MHASLRRAREHRHLQTLRRQRRPESGFTIMELLIATVVLAVIVSLALPSYLDSIRKSRRADAVAALNAVQQAQERWRANRPTYSAHLATTEETPGLGLPGTTANGYYTVSLSGASATGYTVTATAVSGTSQANDGSCQRMAVRMAGGNIEYGSGATEVAFPDAHRCWVRQ